MIKTRKFTFSLFRAKKGLIAHKCMGENMTVSGQWYHKNIKNWWQACPFLWFYCGKKGCLFLAVNKKWVTIQADKSPSCVAAVWPTCWEVWDDVGLLDQEWDHAHWSDRFTHTNPWNYKSCCGPKIKDHFLTTFKLLLLLCFFGKNVRK